MSRLGSRPRQCRLCDVLCFLCQPYCLDCTGILPFLQHVRFANRNQVFMLKLWNGRSTNNLVICKLVLSQVRRIFFHSTKRIIVLALQGIAILEIIGDVLLEWEFILWKRGLCEDLCFLYQPYCSIFLQFGFLQQIFIDTYDRLMVCS